MKLNRSMFNQEMINKYDGALKAMVDNAEIIDGAKTLEIGCAESEMSVVLSKLGCEAWGVDVNDWKDAWGGLNFNFIKGNFQDIEVPKNYFDTVIDICALHHFGIGGYGDKKDLEADIKSSWKIYNCLKKGGEFYSAFDRFSDIFLPENEGFYRQYNLEQFYKRICLNKFVVEYYRLYRNTYDKEKEFHEIEMVNNMNDAKILFIKMRKI
jgi:ubiquinone/menaquinone biosynthesis C-methylase UbiE